MNTVLSSSRAAAMGLVASAGLGCCGVGGWFERRRCYLSAALPDGNRGDANNHHLWPSDVGMPYAANPSGNHRLLRRGVDTEHAHRTIVLPGRGEIGHKVILPPGTKIEQRLVRRDAQAVRALGIYQSDNKQFEGHGEEVEMEVMLHRYSGVVASERAKRLRMKNRHLVSSSPKPELSFRNAHVVHLHEPSDTLEDKKMSFFGVHSLTPPGGRLYSSSNGLSHLSIFVDMEGGGGLDLHLTKPSQFCEKEHSALLQAILGGLMLEQHNNGSSASHVPYSVPSVPSALQLFQMGMQYFERVVSLGAGDQEIRLRHKLKSLEFLRKAYELESKLPMCKRMVFMSDWRTLIMHLGILLCSMGELDEATDVLSRASEEDVAFPGHRYNLACVHAVAGRSEEALRELEAAYRLQLLIPEKSQVLLGNPFNEWCFKGLQGHPGMERIAHLYLGKTLSC